MMGLDFIKKAAPSFRKSLDRRLVALRTPTLFNRDIPAVARSASAEICNGATLAPGEKVHLRIISNKLVVQRDNVVVAEFRAPPLEFFNRVAVGAGIEKGVVQTVGVLSQTMEVTFCE